MPEHPGLKVKNYMEAIVLQNIDEVLAGYVDVCKCEQCVCDIVALVLNELPPRYAATDLGETYLKTQALDPQFKADLFTSISKAANIVRDNPRHNPQAQR